MRFSLLLVARVTGCFAGGDQTVEEDGMLTEERGDL